MSNGLHAQQSGKRLENYVAEVLDDLGYNQVQSKLFLDLKSHVGNPVYARQCYTGTSLSGRRRRVDIILHHPEKWKGCLVIQCKWQSEKGTADEKYPFEVLSINKNPYPTIIILESYKPTIVWTIYIGWTLRFSTFFIFSRVLNLDVRSEKAYLGFPPQVS